MTVNSGAAVQADRALGPRYKWIALSNTTLGMLMATINQSIVLIALPDIFRGIGLNPLSPDNTSYLLWMFMGFLVVSAVLVVSFGRRAADRGELPAAGIRPGGLRLLAVRDRHRPQRLRLRPVLLAELGGDDELGPARQARRGWRHDRHRPELRPT
jgi:hypothetical protein